MSMPYVGARSWLFRREAGAADGLRCRDLLTGAVGQPAYPVLPPGALVPLRARQPLLGLGRRLRIDEVPEPSVLRVGHHRTACWPRNRSAPAARRRPKPPNGAGPGTASAAAAS